MTSFLSKLRKRKRLLEPFRTLHYRLWQISGISGIRGIRPEVRQLLDIARRSPAEGFATAPGGPKILFFTFRSWNTHTVADVLTAHALRLRGADVRVFTCGGRLPVCDVTSHILAPPMPCNTCAPFVTSTVAALRLPCYESKDFITADERTEILRRVMALSPEEYESFEFEGLPIGRLVRASLQWFLLTGSPADDAEAREIYRSFLVSGATIARVAGRLLESFKPDRLVLLNGIFFAERIAIEHARRRGIPFITHEGGFMPDTQVFMRDGFAPHHDVSEFWPDYASRPLTATEARLLDAFLAERTSGKRDVSRYYPTIESDAEAIRRELGLDRDRPIVTVFTNVDWDTATFAARSAFANMEHWLQHTIRYFAGRPQDQLIIRIHPAEVRLPFLEPRQSVTTMVRRHFPELPPNVRLIDPTSSLSSYTLMSMSALGLVYTSTTGMEMALRGKPVVVAGRSYYSGKGFTFDAASPEHFEELIERALSTNLTNEQVELARRYAFLFFFRHHIPFPLTTTSTGSRIRFNFDSLDELRPGNVPFLDLVCDGILQERPFLYDGEFTDQP